MQITNDLMGFFKEQGIEYNFVEEAEYKLLSFNSFDEGTNNIFNIVIIIANDEETAEIYIKLENEMAEGIELYRLLNEYNIAYTGLQFLYIDNSITIKSGCVIDNTYTNIVTQMIENLNIAIEEFAVFADGEEDI